jgi:uncharacterized YceG family protein
VSRGRLALGLAALAVLATATVAGAVPDRQFKVVFPEGFTRARMVDQVAAVRRIAERELRTAHEPARLALTGSGYARASAHVVVSCFGSGTQRSAEGFLFPSTYSFDVRTLAANIVANQIAAFCGEWSRLDLGYARSKNLTSYDVLTIASMVEAEAALPGDRPKVAAVVYNRLRLGMPLGIDATLRYGLHIPPTKSITQVELASNSAYNTRKRKGLPPTPIDNPGVLSLRAAAHPSTLGYLYYARIPGTKRQKFFESYTAYQKFLQTHGYGPHP